MRTINFGRKKIKGLWGWDSSSTSKTSEPQRLAQGHSAHYREIHLLHSDSLTTIPVPFPLCLGFGLIHALSHCLHLDLWHTFVRWMTQVIVIFLKRCPSTLPSLTESMETFLLMSPLFLSSVKTMWKKCQYQTLHWSHWKAFLS